MDDIYIMDQKVKQRKKVKRIRNGEIIVKVERNVILELT
jgi:hypothetical protein